MTSESPKLVSALKPMDWLKVFEPVLIEQPELAEVAAQLSQRLLAMIEGGPEGIRDARDCLQQGIRALFPFTGRYKECRDLFEAALARESNPE
jgi:hypothetical protein